MLSPGVDRMLPRADCSTGWKIVWHSGHLCGDKSEIGQEGRRVACAADHHDHIVSARYLIAQRSAWSSPPSLFGSNLNKEDFNLFISHAFGMRLVQELNISKVAPLWWHCSLEPRSSSSYTGTRWTNFQVIIIQMPAARNNHTMIVEFDDNPFDAADIYQIELDISFDGKP